MNKLNIIIPVYNGEKTINKTLKDFDRKLLKKINKILIIDNNSNDKTISFLKNYLKKNVLLKKKIIIKKNNKNGGYGYSIKKGFDFFIKNNNDYICIIHADFQERPSKILNNFLKKIKENTNLNVILSSRFLKKSNIKNYSLIRVIGNLFFNKLTYLCSSYKMSDAGSAIILIHRNILKKISYRLLSNHWHFHPQLNLILYHLKDAKISEIPLNWRDSEAVSEVPLLRYCLKLLILLIKFWFKKNILKIPVKKIFT